MSTATNGGIQPLFILAEHVKQRCFGGNSTWRTRQSIQVPLATKEARLSWLRSRSDFRWAGQ